MSDRKTCSECPWKIKEDDIFFRCKVTDEQLNRFDQAENEECAVRRAFRVLRDAYRAIHEDREGWKRTVVDLTHEKYMALAEVDKLESELARVKAEVLCHECRGLGTTEVSRGEPYPYTDCPTCNGTGRKYND